MEKIFPDGGCKFSWTLFGLLMPVCRRFANKIDAIPHLKPVKSGQITMIRCQGPSRQNHLCAIHSNSVLSISNFHQPPKNSSRKAHVGKTSPGLSLELAGLDTINSWACSVNPRNCTTSRTQTQPKASYPAGTRTYPRPFGCSRICNHS